MAIDYAGSTRQVDCAINTVLSYTYAYSAYAVKTIIAPDIPNNEGCFRPLSVTAPEGTVVNPRYPAPCGARSMIGHLTPPAILGALAPVLPDKVLAPPGSPTNTLQFAGMGQGQRYAVTSFLSAGLGASASRSGDDAMHFPSNLSNTPIEMLEGQAPIRVIRRSIRKGSGGAGARKGGNGISFEFEVVGDEPIAASILLNRVRVPAAGLMGGEAGAPARFLVNGVTADPSVQTILNQGDVVLIESAGGGGFGRPDGESSD